MLARLAREVRKLRNQLYALVYYPADSGQAVPDIVRSLDRAAVLWEMPVAFLLNHQARPRRPSQEPRSQELAYHDTVHSYTNFSYAVSIMAHGLVAGNYGFNFSVFHI